MCAAMQMSLSSLRASVTEGRSENVRYRQDQLQALHTGFRENVDATTEAIAIDSGCTAEEADVEFYLGMDALRKAYESLNFESSLQQEYQVAHGKDNVERRVAMGLVAIRPSQHSRFYSTLAPLVAALAAGNCILLEVNVFFPLEKIGTDMLIARYIARDIFAQCRCPTCKGPQERLRSRHISNFCLTPR
jgi:acyl-CoA reductase-like NAD-dependent aldehyde dehydrogenase